MAAVSWPHCKAFEGLRPSFSAHVRWGEGHPSREEGFSRPSHHGNADETYIMKHDEVPQGRLKIVQD